MFKEKCKASIQAKSKVRKWLNDSWLKNVRQLQLSGRLFCIWRSILHLESKTKPLEAQRDPFQY
jgi:hypothetical protein